MSKSNGESECNDLYLTIQNLPFSTTKSELEEEFPTAKSIQMNVNKIGRFKGYVSVFLYLSIIYLQLLETNYCII